jgi:hypothetical protein
MSFFTYILYIVEISNICTLFCANKFIYFRFKLLFIFKNVYTVYSTKLAITKIGLDENIVSDKKISCERIYTPKKNSLCILNIKLSFNSWTSLFTERIQNIDMREWWK